MILRLARFIGCLLAALAWCELCPGASALADESGGSEWICKRLGDWADAEDRSRTPTLDVYARSEQLLKAMNEKRRVASDFFEIFIRGGLSIPAIARCLKDRDNRGDFIDFLHARFLEKEVERVAGAQTPSSLAFVSKLKERFGDASMVFFRMTGHGDDLSPNDLKGGYRDATGSVYVDWTRTTPDEWQVILVHELLHSLDARIQDAATVIDAPGNVMRAVGLVHAHAAYEALSDEDREFLRSWVRAGLDRGLWSEYRAWVGTLAVYREGLEAGLWRAIPWLDALLAECAPGIGFASCFYSLLDRRSKDHQSGLFAESPIRQAIAAERERARAQPPSLLEIEAIGATIALKPRPGLPLSKPRPRGVRRPR